MTLEIHSKSAVPSRTIGHLEVGVTLEAEAINALSLAVKGEQRGVWSFCNAHTVNLAHDDPSYREALKGVILLNDGIGLDVASKRLYGEAFPENLNGTDLSPKLFAALSIGTRVFLVGGTPETAYLAAIRFRISYPHLELVGSHHGYFNPDENAHLLRIIDDARTDLVVVGMGQPLQEKWAVSAAATISVPFLCVGALIDRLAGKVPRAPVFVRKIRCEWIYRLALEPRRLARRYLWGNAIFLLRLQRQYYSMKKSERA